MKAKKRLLSVMIVFALMAVLWLPATPAMADELIRLDVANNTLNGVGGLLNGLGVTIGDTTATLGSALDDVTDAVGNVVGGVGDLLEGILGGVGQTTGSLVINVGDTVGNLLGGQTQTGEVVVVFHIGDTHYTINGQTATMDVAPYIKNSRCYLPARFVGYSLGISPGNIFWDKATRTATLSKNGTTERLTAGSNVMYINNMAVQIDAPAEIVSPGRVMLPYRWVAEGFGANVSWDQASQTVTIQYTI